MDRTVDSDNGNSDSAEAKQPLPSINLPKGGGAIRGIDEKFSVNAINGTGSTTIPLPLSPGRSGFGPQLSLAYDSGSGNQAFGLGWNLSLSAITRKTDKGLPRYWDQDESDVFLLSGAEDLVPLLVQNELTNHVSRHSENQTVEGVSYQIQRYRPRTEGLFSRIERWQHSQTGEIHWRSISSDNITTLYGRTTESRIVDAADSTKIFSWLVCESYDDKGNAVVYRYKNEDSTNLDLSQLNENNRTELSRSTNRYVKRILYGNRTAYQQNEDLHQRNDWMFEVVFDYGEGHYQPQDANPSEQQFINTSTTELNNWPSRLDPISSHRAGFEVRGYRLCQRVLMFHHFAEELGVDDYLVRAVHLNYQESPINTLLTSMSQSSYLRQQDGTFLEHSLPDIDYEYSQASIQTTVHDIDSDSIDNLPSGLSDVSYQWVDLDGEGLSGILKQQGGSLFYKRNAGNAQFDAHIELPSKPSLTALNSSQQLLDLEGDGQLDVVMLEGPAPGFYQRTKDKHWSTHESFTHLPSINWSDPNTRFIDLTGDGRPDILVTENRAFTWYSSLGKKGYSVGERVSHKEDEEAGPRLVFSDLTQSVYLADMSGDGLTDIVRIRNGDICYWPNRGYGHFGAKVSMGNAPHFDSTALFDHQRIRLADIDGSGVPDILYIQSNNQVVIYTNQAGNAWANAEFISHVPTLDKLSTIHLVDLFGNGTACLVWSSPLPGNRNRPMRYIDLMGGQKPYLLITSRNNMGAETRIHYAASTKFYLQDKLAGRPWITQLPFPVQVVERVEVFDHISRNRFTTRYAYHHGFFDGVEREFRGFGMVEQWDTEEYAALTETGDFSPNVFTSGVNIDERSHVPPVHTKTWFHTGVYLGGQRVSNYFAGLLGDRNSGEYYREPGLSTSQVAQRLLADTVLPAGLTIDEEREACRALKGSVLRQEVYALDGSAQEPHPYTVSENNYTVQVLQSKEGNRHAVFLTHAREALSFNYERNPTDPRISHAVTLSVDDFGNVLQSASIAYGRVQADPQLSQADQQRQAQLFVTSVENRFTHSVNEINNNRTPLPCEVTSFEVTGLALGPNQIRFEFFQLEAALQEASQLDYHLSPTSGIQKRLIEQTRIYFRPNDFGESENDPQALLPFAGLESLALPGESYTLAFTLPHYNTIFGERIDATLLPELLRDEGHYVQLEDVNDDERWWIPSGRIFLSPNEDDNEIAERNYSQQHFYVPLRALDPFGQTSVVRYDPFDLMQVDAQDALGNRITAGERTNDGSITPRLNYRMLQAELMTDPNGNRSAVAFDVLGLVVGTAVMGKATGTIEGDNLEGFQAQLTQAQIDEFFSNPRSPIAHALLGNATSRIIYNQNRFSQSGQPAVAATLVRETHVSELNANEETIVQVSLAYSDGFDRVIQSKVQAEPGAIVIEGPIVNPRWTASAWTIFNNKGEPVKQYEPYFSADHQFEFGIEVGVSPTLFYDPVGRVVATLHPNHSWEKVVFDQWRQESWDVNDTLLIDPASDLEVGPYFQRVNTSDYLPTWHQARIDGNLGDAEQNAAEKSAAHAQTPGVNHFDSLGRPFLSIANNGPSELFETRTEQDIEGNVLAIIDARGNRVMEYRVTGGNGTAATAYDVAGRQLFENSMDAGESHVLPDISGKPIRSWNARGHRQRAVYDQLQRPMSIFVSLLNDPLNDIQPEILTDLTLFGEHHPNAEALNLRGVAYQVYDGAGMITSSRNDFKGNLLQGERQLAQEYRNTVDWIALSNITDLDELESITAPLLETEIFSNSVEYDALNRLLSTSSPDNSVTIPRYNEANLLERVEVRLQGAQIATGFVDNIDYNARGQRERITYTTTDGSNFTTRYEYDSDTFRLTRLHTLRHSDSSTLQDLNYAYDPVGNIMSIRDNAQQTVFFSNALIEPHHHYTYDALYRLIEAQGREHAVQNDFQRDASDFESIIGIPFANSPQALQRYTEAFIYDSVGNILSMNHRGGDIQRWQRGYQYAADNNRLLATSLPGDSEAQFSASYSYDIHGNMIRMPHLPLMQWNEKDQLQASSRQVLNGGTPETTYYVYDGAGERVRKITERQVTEQQAANGQTPTRINERIYLGGFEVYREFNNDETIELERQTLHIMDDQQRIALVDTRTQGNDDSPLQSVRYQLSNHLGSASLELDQQANIISYEEYHAYGTSAYRSGRSQAEISLKRYRYTGMERDEETGLNYHGARYYTSWLGRWTAADPIGIGDGMNVYRYVSNNGISKVDVNGQAETDTSNVDVDELRTSNVQLNHKLNLALSRIRRDLNIKPGQPITQEQRKELVWLVSGIGWPRGGGGMNSLKSFVSRNAKYNKTLVEKWAEKSLPIKAAGKKYRRATASGHGLAWWVGDTAVNPSIVIEFNAASYSEDSVDYNEKVAIGTDKLGHFFGQGYELFDLKVLKGGTMKDVAAKNDNWESGNYGLKTTGIYSNADNEANLAGLEFYSELFNDPFLKFDIANYVDNSWSELPEHNPNEYTPEMRHLVYVNAPDQLTNEQKKEEHKQESMLKEMDRLNMLPGQNIAGGAKF